MTPTRRPANQGPLPDDQLAAQLRYAGAVGEQVTVTGTISHKAEVLGRRYSTVSTLLEINCGTSIVTIFSTAHWAKHAELGEQVTVTGTVKKHQSWRGTPQTVIGWTTRDDITTGRQARRTADGTTGVTSGWPAGKVTIRRRFPDDPDAAASPNAPTTAAADRSRR